jgi:hypothetical protein
VVWECWSFDSSWCFISAKCGSNVSAKFLIYGAYAVCFYTLVSIHRHFFFIWLWLGWLNLLIPARISWRVLRYPGQWWEDRENRETSFPTAKN